MSQNIMKMIAGTIFKIYSAEIFTNALKTVQFHS